MHKIIDLENIKLTSINSKFCVGKKRGKDGKLHSNLYLSKDYAEFKKIITESVIKVFVKKPYEIKIEYSGYVDIDAFIKPLFDGLEDTEIIENDRYIEKLEIIKKPIKRGKLGTLTVFINSL
jgi:Holliday junction resolvase RusA-like endonuclease